MNKINPTNKSMRFTCPTCGHTRMIRGRELTQVKMRKKRNPNYHGPFCNKSCAATYSYSRLVFTNKQLELPFEKNNNDTNSK